MSEKRRVFTFGVDRIVYDPDSEEWYLNGAVEGRMSTLLAADIMAGLANAKYELYGVLPEHDPSWPAVQLEGPSQTPEKK